MNHLKIMRAKPLLYWSVYSRVGLALFLSLVMWGLAIGVTYLS